MATEVVSTIRASGGDYTSLSSWEAGEQADLVTADQIAVAECYDDWESGLDDWVEINGWVTDSTRYVKITVADGHRHDGTPQSGFFLQKNLGYGRIVWIRADYTVVEYLDVDNIGTGGDGIDTDYRDCVVDKCIVKAVDQAIKRPGNLTKIRNTLLRYSGSAISLSDSAGGYTAQNVTAAYCGTGFTGDGAQTLQNCAGYGCTTNYVGTFAGASSNNASSDYSGDPPPGSNPYTSDVTSSDFVDTALQDFHLASGSGLIGQGANLYSTFTEDIDGETRPSSGAWDIGADYYIASGGVTLTVLDAIQSHSANAVDLIQNNTLVINESTHSQSAENIDLAQDNQLITANAIHAQTSDNIDLIQSISLVVADAIHSQYADALTLVQHNSLVVDGALHSHIANNINLAQANQLDIDGAVHSQTSNSIVLSSGSILSVADALHGHIADFLELVQANMLTVDDAAHSQTADALDLSQAQVLTINSALHSHTAENVTLDFAVVLNVSDAAQVQSVDSVDLIQDSVLSILDAVHAHTANNIDLITSATLIVDSALHAQIADNISLFTGVLQMPPDSRVFAIQHEDRIFMIAAEDRIFSIH